MDNINVPEFMAVVEQKRKAQEAARRRQLAIKKKQAQKKKKMVKAVITMGLLVTASAGAYYHGSQLYEEFFNKAPEPTKEISPQLEENAKEIHSTYMAMKTNDESENLSILCNLIQTMGLDEYDGLDMMQVVDKYFDMIGIEKEGTFKRIKMFEQKYMEMEQSAIVVAR